MFFILTACKQDDAFNQRDSLAEEGTVNTIVTDPDLIRTPSSFKILPNQGKKGVIVFNTGIPSIPFRAFDLGCPYIDPNSCDKGMAVDSAGTMTCGNCDGNDEQKTFTSIKTTTKTTINGEERTLHLIEYLAILEGSSIRITNVRR